MLQTTDQLLALDNKLAANLGPCEAGRPALQGVPGHVCRPLHCLWSHLLARNIALGFGVVELQSEHVEGLQPCPIARGGQLGHRHSAMSQLLVSFTLLVGHDDLLAAQVSKNAVGASVSMGVTHLPSSLGTLWHMHVSQPASHPTLALMSLQTLVHLFRTAQEAASAEFLLITGSRDILKGSSMAQRYPLLHSVSLQLLSAFGVNVRQVHSTRSGPWAEAQAGMEAAAGTYVVLVRAGTLPLAGWLHTLLDTFAAHPRAAAVGPLVLSPSGQVLEAGGLLASNASPALLGSGGLPAAAPALLHLRHVDFVGAGAVLALRREAALAAGGFDHRLQLYLGDVDLGMALRQQGHHVLVQVCVLQHMLGNAWRAWPSAGCARGPRACSVDYRKHRRTQP